MEEVAEVLVAEKARVVALEVRALVPAVRVRVAAAAPVPVMAVAERGPAAALDRVALAVEVARVQAPAGVAVG
jgi:hypothetical protein